MTCVRKPYPGASLGIPAYINQSVSEKMERWYDNLQLLFAFTSTQPHAAFAAFGHGLHVSSKWSYTSQILPQISHLLRPLENIIRTVFIPFLTSQLPPSGSDRELFALHVRLGGTWFT